MDIQTLFGQAQELGATFPFPVAALISGFFATVLMTLAVILMRAALRTKMSIPLMLGNFVVPKAGDQGKRKVGATMHLAIGSMWGFVFGVLVENDIIFSDVSILTGILFALIPWAVMIFILMPLMGAGIFGFSLNSRAWLLTLVGHIVYGASLAWFIPLLFLA